MPRNDRASNGLILAPSQSDQFVFDPNVFESLLPFGLTFMNVGPDDGPEPQTLILQLSTVRAIRIQSDGRMELSFVDQQSPLMLSLEQSGNLAEKVTEISRQLKSKVAQAGLAIRTH